MRVEGNLAHLILSPAILHHFSFLCPCPVLRWCPIAAARHSVSARPGTAALLPRPGRATLARPGGTLAPSGAGHGLPPRAAACQVKAFQRDVLASSPYLSGRAPCDGGLRLAGSCMFSLGKPTVMEGAAGSASAAGSARASRAAERAGTVRTALALSPE